MLLPRFRGRWREAREATEGGWALCDVGGAFDQGARSSRSLIALRGDGTAAGTARTGCNSGAPLPSPPPQAGAGEKDTSLERRDRESASGGIVEAGRFPGLRGSNAAPGRSLKAQRRSPPPNEVRLVSAYAQQPTVSLGEGRRDDQSRDQRGGYTERVV